MPRHWRVAARDERLFCDLRIVAICGSFGHIGAFVMASKHDICAVCDCGFGKTKITGRQR